MCCMQQQLTFCSSITFANRGGEGQDLCWSCWHRDLGKPATEILECSHIKNFTKIVDLFLLNYFHKRWWLTSKSICINLILINNIFFRLVSRPVTDPVPGPLLSYFPLNCTVQCRVLLCTVHLQFWKYETYYMVTNIKYITAWKIWNIVLDEKCDI